MDDAAEAVPSENAHIRHGCGWTGTPGGRDLVQCPVRPVAVVVICVPAEDEPQVLFAGDQSRLNRGDRTEAEAEKATSARGAEKGAQVLISVLSPRNSLYSPLLPRPRRSGTQTVNDPERRGKPGEVPR